MNLDDAKLTAFALDELDEPERSTIARAVAASPDAQRVVDETREVARALKNEFAADLNKRRIGDRRSLADIRDDPWFWSVARPLAIAAGVAIFAILGAIAVGTYNHSRNGTGSGALPLAEFAEVETADKLQSDAASDFAGPDKITNPLRGEDVQRIERVVIGEISSEEGEMRVIEIVSDAFRIQKLRERLATRVLSKKAQRGFVGREYDLVFLDRDDHVLAGAAFCRAPDLGFVLQPLQKVGERNGHYFPGRGEVFLPGDWDSGINYLGYAIPFPDWAECIGYSPSV